MNHYSPYLSTSSIHAEYTAINNIKQKLNKKIINKQDIRGALSLYVFKLYKDGSFGHSFPCDNCIKNIKKQLKIQNIYYSINNSQLGYFRN